MMDRKPRHALTYHNLSVGITPQTVKLDFATAISLFSPGVKKGTYINKNINSFSGEGKDVGSRTGTHIIKHMVDTIRSYIMHVVEAFCHKDPMGLVYRSTRCYDSA